MKRYVHAKTINETVQNIAQAKRDLAKYSDEQIEYVKECQDEIGREIARFYAEEEELGDHVREIGISAIKTDYLMGAIEDELMTEEEFEEIFDLLDVIGLELAQSYA